MPPSPRTPYFSIQKLSLASITKGSELLVLSLKVSIRIYSHTWLLWHLVTLKRQLYSKFPWVLFLFFKSAQFPGIEWNINEAWQEIYFRQSAFSPNLRKEEKEKRFSRNIRDNRSRAGDNYRNLISLTKHIKGLHYTWLSRLGFRSDRTKLHTWKIKIVVQLVWSLLTKLSQVVVTL